MSRADFIALLPLMITSASAVLSMIAIAIRRNHVAAALIAFVGLAATLGCLAFTASILPRQIHFLLHPRFLLPSLHGDTPLCRCICVAVRL